MCYREAVLDNETKKPEKETKKPDKETKIYEPSDFHGPLAWMAKNHVAANLLMIMFIVGGLVLVSSLKQELMPNVEAERISISASYPGSTPDEVEEGKELRLICDEDKRWTERSTFYLVRQCFRALS